VKGEVRGNVRGEARREVRGREGVGVEGWVRGEVGQVLNEELKDIVRGEVRPAGTRAASAAPSTSLSS
jgi:hypothetical protein